MKFSFKYFIAFLILLVIEILIGAYVKDAFIRPYVGDVLVVILIYTFIRSFIDGHQFKISLGVLLFAFMVEILQYFNIVTLLGLAEYPLARIIIGTSFAWEDFLCYFVGYLIILLLEKWHNITTS